MLEAGLWRVEGVGLAPAGEGLSLRVSDRRRASFRRGGVSPPGGLTGGTDALLGRDPVYRRRLQTVLKRQKALQGLVTSAGWRAYLELEEAEFDRWAHAVDRVARWAFTRGRRERGRR